MTALFQAITETGPLLATGFDGVVGFGGFFALMTLPKSPLKFQRSENSPRKILDRGAG